MSHTRDLTLGYVRFFAKTFDFAVSPYTWTFEAAGRRTRGHFDLLSATLAVGLLTFVAPVLPALFSVTSTLASLAASIAVASMFVLYPIALIQDLFSYESPYRDDEVYGY